LDFKNIVMKKLIIVLFLIVSFSANAQEFQAFMWNDNPEHIREITNVTSEIQGLEGFYVIHTSPVFDNYIVDIKFTFYKDKLVMYVYKFEISDIVGNDFDDIQNLLNVEHSNIFASNNSTSTMATCDDNTIIFHTLKSNVHALGYISPYYKQVLNDN